MQFFTDWHKFVVFRFQRYCRYCCQLFTLPFSSVEPFCLFQPNWVQTILGWRTFKLFKWRWSPILKEGMKIGLGVLKISIDCSIPTLQAFWYFEKYFIQVHVYKNTLKRIEQQALYLYLLFSHVVKVHI